MAEFAFAFPRERPGGIIFVTRRPRFHRDAVAQNVEFHAGKIHAATPGAMSGKRNIFELGFRVDAL